MKPELEKCGYRKQLDTGENVFTMEWKPSATEIDAILSGGSVTMLIFSEVPVSMPAVGMRVTDVKGNPVFDALMN